MKFKEFLYLYSTDFKHNITNVPVLLNKLEDMHKQCFLLSLQVTSIYSKILSTGNQLFDSVIALYQ